MHTLHIDTYINGFRFDNFIPQKKRDVRQLSGSGAHRPNTLLFVTDSSAELKLFGNNLVNISNQVLESNTS